MRRVSSLRMVGRADTLAALDGALAHATEGAPRLIVLAGEAGIGKTRLARELSLRAGAQGHQVLWGECVPLQAGELPYAPIVAALRTLGPERGAARDELGALLAELREGRSAEAAAAAQAPARLFELLLRALGRLAEEAPTLFVVEDVHWADAATQDVLRFLARNLREERLLLVVTLRTDEPDVAPPLRGLLAELARSARGERLELSRLTAGDTALQVAGIVESPAAALAEWVHARAEGNPYFAEELLAARVAGERDDVLPDSLREVLLARMASLDGPPRQVLHLAAAAGRDIGHELLVRASGLDADALGAALHQLVDAHVFVCDRASERYRFRHALAREAVYVELLPPERRALHAALARALDAAVPERDRGAAEWAALAQHWEGAHEDAAALRASVAAATAAQAVYAFQAARTHLDRARALWNRVEPAARPAGLDEVELLERLADATRFAGDRDAAIPIAEAALVLVDPAAEPRHAASLHTLLADLHSTREEALRQLNCALALLPPEPPPERAAALCLAGRKLVYGELPSETRSFALEALDAARAAGALAEEGLANMTLGIAFAYGGDAETGLAHFGEAIRIAREVGRVDRLAAAINNLADALLMLGRLDEALTTLEAGYEEVRALGLALSHGVVIQATMAECELRLGRWDEASERLERLLESAHDDEMRLMLIGLLVALRAREGRFETAEALDREAAALVAANVGPQSLVLASTARAEFALLRGDPDAARAIVRETREAVDFGGIVCYPSMLLVGVQAEADLAEHARAATLGHEVERARAAAEELFGAPEAGGSLRAYRYENPLDEPGPPETRALWAQGEAELTRLNGASRGPLWAEVAAQWDRLRYPYPAAYARLRETEARLASGGERAAATLALRAAHAAFRRLGAAPLREEAEALARRGRIALAQEAEEPAPERPFDLTGRELTVLERLAVGQTNRTIADDLYLSTRTVDMHVRNILGKLNAANRVEAAATAHRLGLAGDTAVLP
ncbi:MAG: AAA family ATPase [Solirubrobacteraceae bacterium]